MVRLKSSHSYFASKVVRYSIIMIIVLTINFLIPRMMPGDPLRNQFGEDYTRMDPVFIEAQRAKYGLDKPLLDQYIAYLSSVARLDLGYSIHQSMSVLDIIEKRLFWTMVITIPAIILGGLLALYLGTLTGLRRGRWFDKVVTGGSMLVYSIPTFFIAMMAVTIFSFYLGWFPLGQIYSGTTEGGAYMLDVAWHLFLPISVLALAGATNKYLVIRNSVTQILDENFIFVARAKGLSDGEIARKHVIRNVLPQFISMMALSFGFIVTGAMLIEIVFSIKGMGSLLYDAISMRDYPVIQGIFVILMVFVLVSNFAADILYGITDPRIRDAKVGGHAQKD